MEHKEHDHECECCGDEFCCGGKACQADPILCGECTRYGMRRCPWCGDWTSQDYCSEYCRRQVEGDDIVSQADHDEHRADQDYHGDKE